MHRVAARRRLPAFRCAACLAFLLILPAAAPAQGDAAREASEAARAEPAPAPDERAAQEPAGPEDRWNRGTPRGALLGFIEAGRARRWSDAAAALDLSALPASEREARGPDLARKLKFLLDQELWIDLDAVSNHPAGRLDDGLPAERELVGTLTHEDGSAPVHLDRGPRDDGVPVWRFSSATVVKIPALWEQLGPPALIEGLPPVLIDTRFLELALWQWIGLLALVVVAWLLAWAIASVVVRLARPLTLRSRTQLDDRLLALTVGPIRLLVAVGAFNAGLHLLLLSVPASSFMREGSKFLVIAAVAWCAWRVIDLCASIGRERFLQRGRAGAAHLVPLGARAIKVTVLVITVLATLDTFGFDVTAVIAGLGVGGLAVALAAQKTVENVFGGMSVLVDQPIRPGDFCRFGDKVGTVEDIGLRSTRIRTLDRTVVSVPNAEFSTLQIENFAKRDRIRLIATLGLRYETTADQLRHVIAALRAMLIAHPRVLPDPLRVRLVAFGAYSIDLELFAYVNTTDYNEFLAVREDIFLHAMDVVSGSGTGFAFPSTTTYLARDRGLDGNRGAAAEAEIERLRSEGQLPFPDHSPAAAKALDDTLDWPPKGSAAAAPVR